MVFHFCPHLKSPFTVAAISRVQTEIAYEILNGLEAYIHAYTQVQGQTSPIVCLFTVNPHEVLYWFYGFHFCSSWSLGLVLFFSEIFVYPKWRRNKNQSRFIHRILRLFKQRNKMQGGNLTLQYCTVCSPVHGRL